MSLAETDIPLIPRGVRLHFDKVRDTWVLLAPERTVRLDPIGHAILSEVDGARDLAAIVSILADKYDAPAKAIFSDANEFLGGLRERRFLEVVG